MSTPVATDGLFAKRFEIDQEVGSGGGGTVYRARDTWSDGLVALKLLNPQGGASPDAERFSRESQLLAALSHPGIVGYVAHGQTADGIFYLAMEWLQGEDLGQFLRRQRLSLHDAHSMMRTVAGALALAHSQGIVHRDLKPSNLFLLDGKPEQVKILDFGIARRIMDMAMLTRAGATVGTPAYMAPEQAQATRQITAAADIFALGCVFYECLTGQPAFYADNVAAILARVLFDQARRPSELNPEITPALDRLIARMLSKDPAQRIPDAMRLLVELEEAERLSKAEPKPRDPLAPSQPAAALRTEVNRTANATIRDPRAEEDQDAQLMMVLVDIAGYMPFMAQHRKALKHSQIIISSLVEVIRASLKAPLQIAKLGASSVFAYVHKQEADPDWQAQLQQSVQALFTAYSEKHAEIIRTNVCRCEGCRGVEKLHVRVILHSGEAQLSESGQLEDLSDVDVIIAHQLLKNSVRGDQYLLMTEAARADLPGLGPIDAEHLETYESLDPIQTYVHYPRTNQRPGTTLSKTVESPTSPVAMEILRYEVRQEYCDVAQNPHKTFHFYTGYRLAKILGYSDEMLEGIPQRALDCLAGTGNPLSMGEMRHGWNVVDIGCGSGLDSLLAARQVGPQGRVIGVDMTAEMLANAVAAGEELGTGNVEFRAGYAEALPVENEWANAVISNGAINLSPDKPTVFREIFRVLKPGGRFQIGDIRVSRPIPDGAKRNLDLWTG